MKIVIDNENLHKLIFFQTCYKNWVPTFMIILVYKTKFFQSTYWATKANYPAVCHENLFQLELCIKVLD